MFKNLNPRALGASGHESEIIELALTYGFRGVDINIVEFASRVKLRGMAYARRLIDSARLLPGTFSLPLDCEEDEEAFKRDLEKLRSYAQLAGEIGCVRCVATIAPASDRRPYHENFEFHRRRLAEISEALQPAGVRLGLGFRAAKALRKNQAFQFIHGFDALLLLVNMVGAPNIGILLDVWDLCVSGGSVENLGNLPSRQIVAVRLADAPADQALASLGEESRLLPAPGGAIDLASFLTVLMQTGYDGPVTPSPSRATLDGIRRDTIIKAAGDGLSRLWKAAGLASEGRVSAMSATR